MTRAGRGHARGRLAAGAGGARRASRRPARRADGRFVPAVIVGARQARRPRARRPAPISTCSSSSATGTGRTTDGADPRRRPHVLQRRRSSGWPARSATSPPAGVAFAGRPAPAAGQQGQRLRGERSPRSSGTMQEHGDLWERQTLTRARLVLGDRAPRRARVRATLRRLVYGAPLPRTRAQGDRGGAHAHGSASWARRRPAAGT